MLTLAAMEALTRVGGEITYRTLRKRHPRLHETSTLYLRPLLRLVGAYGDAHDLTEIGKFLHAYDATIKGTVLDSMREILIRVGVQVCDDSTWQNILSFLSETKIDGERYHSILLLGMFSANNLVREALIEYLQSPNKVDRLASVEALAACPGAAHSLRARMLLEQDPEVQQGLEACFRMCQ
jgi:hypothetical protein